MAYHYRKCIRGFSQLTKFLTDLTRDKVGGCWGDAEQQSVLALEAAMVTAPVLYLPDFEKRFIVTTDSSDVGIGVILERGFGCGLQSIAFLSWKLNATEIPDSAHGRELLRIVPWIVEALLTGTKSHYHSNRSRTITSPSQPDISK